MKRVIIIGHPYAGKSTLSRSLNLPIFSTDTKKQSREIFKNVTYLPELDQSDISDFIVSKWFTKPEFVIEGVGAVRALRKWSKMYPNTMPCDKIIFLRNANQQDKHVSMSKAIDTIWSEISGIFARITEYR